MEKMKDSILLRQHHKNDSVDKKLYDVQRQVSKMLFQTMYVSLFYVNFFGIY
uniref:Uncharacterized protein n=1 Tax=Lepeophtheirus salmonis TaxID=72036 RepID=A0A0K2T9T7_LEPSM